MNLLDQLKTDHKNVAHMLDILESQLNRVHRTEPADFDLMRDIMHYMIHYPDRVHHPLEDLAMEKLIEHDPSVRTSCETILREHGGLAKKSAAFLEMLVLVTDGAMVIREQIEAAGRDYVAFLRSHMEKEDERIFPIIEKNLTEEDWSSISAAMERRTDPVFGPVVEQQYQTLYDHIQKHAG